LALSLRLLIDEDSQAKRLVNLLKNAGHDVITVNETGLSGKFNDEVLDYARQNERIILTRNYDDFQELHEANPVHPGIFVVYQDANPSKDMSHQTIVKAIANLEVSGMPLANQFIPLNHWNY
jgi:predicted nuclease of predicted toxin-antitoxin system